MQKSIAFTSTMANDPWGGSEELWSQAALNLVVRGVSVAASVHGWVPPHQRLLNLLQAGVRVQQRSMRQSIWMRAWRIATSSKKGGLALDIEKFLAANRPALVILSDGGPLPPIELVELCVRKRLPFVTVGQANSESWWPDDELGKRYRKVLPDALRCFFVSNANKLLAEKQLGCKLYNAEIVRNPFNIPSNISLPWPSFGLGELRFACVARLHPPSKGQDLLLEALAEPQWTRRNWRLTLYGDGPARDSLGHLVDSLKLSERVTFAGFVPVEEIWASNHALVLPSRFEGLPIAIVEAMMCARPVITTDVGGNSEIIKNGVTGFLAAAPTVSSVEDALERCWLRKAEMEEIGRAAAKSIRILVPADPVDVFSKKLLNLTTF